MREGVRGLRWTYVVNAEHVNLKGKVALRVERGRDQGMGWVLSKKMTARLCTRSPRGAMQRRGTLSRA